MRYNHLFSFVDYFIHYLFPLYILVEHLSKYLAMRLTLDLESEIPDSLTNFCIYISPGPNQFVVLSGMQTLDDVNEKYWKSNQPLEMFYSWKKSSV